LAWSARLCFKLPQAVSNHGETDKRLILLDKSLSVSPFHSFQGEAPGNFKLAADPYWNLAGGVSPKPCNGETAGSFVISINGLTVSPRFETA
jgi:hypothetical protein